ncbi:hypothetical protein TNCV_2344971 [Trichonephila clavipes]|nr:hypothetical protein TNCV_2344971 [Trichonephila clavipes]
MSYEVQLLHALMYHFLTESPEKIVCRIPKLVLTENGRGISDFRLAIYKRSDDSHLRDERQFSYMTLVYQVQRSKCFLPGLDCLQLFDQHHV